jgi:muconolactone delta-isomerase
MEYLVVMTTRVPDGTSEEAIDDIRTREDAHSRELASQGHLLRLWRPPLRPGEWRSLGLFAADDGDELERVLASMPLRVWRSDEVTPLSRHPNDPALEASPGATEFLTTFAVTIPAGTPAQTVEDTKAREAERVYELRPDRRHDRSRPAGGHHQPAGRQLPHMHERVLPSVCICVV